MSEPDADAVAETEPRTELDAEPELVRLISAAFGLPGGDDAVGTLQPVARGAMGRIWRLDLAARARSYAIKELFWGAEEPDIEREASYRDAAARLGVEAPAYLRTAAGGYLTQLPERPGSSPTSLWGKQLRGYAWADGSTARPDEPGIQVWVGTTSGRLHTTGLGLDGFTRDPWYDVPPEPATWPELVARARAAERPWADELEASLPMVARLHALVTPPPDPTALVIGHCDLAAPNVLVHEGRFTLLDWENCGPIAPDRELAAQAYGWNVRAGRLDRDSLRRSLRAYREAGGPASFEGLASFSLMFTTTLNFLHGQVSEALDDRARSEMQAYADDRVTTLLADPPDLELTTALARELATL